VARRPGSPGTNDLFTTHQVAKLLGVSLPTVVNWCRQGKLSAHRTPGGHRRIQQDELLRFLEEHSYPVPRSLTSESESRTDLGGVLIVSSEADFADLVSDYLQLKREYIVRIAEAPLVAGILLGRFSPRVIVWDEDTPGLDLGGIEQAARTSGVQSPRLILTTDFLTLDHRSAMDTGRLYAVLQKPVSLDLLLGSLDRALGSD
jgi:excisionase family DNA binding protein